MKRFASTRSEKRASQPCPGRAQCSVGSIDEDGIRYGLTTHALIASTIAIAPSDRHDPVDRDPPGRAAEPSRSEVGRLGFLTGDAGPRRSALLVVRHSSILAPWSPESRTSGTRQPRNSAGRV